MSQIAVLQPTGNCFSGELSWTPHLRLTDRIGIGGNVGGMVLKGMTGKFAAAEYEALLYFSLSKALALEAGGGMQTWFQDYGGTSPVFSAGVTWLFLHRKQAGLNAGYSRYLPPGNSTNEIKLGAAFNF